MQILIKNQIFDPFRIFCIGKNYGEHIKEQGDRHLPDEPVVFMKPVANLVATNEPLLFPRYDCVLHHEVEAVILIGKEGRDIPEKDAKSYIAGVSIGLDLTLRDIQSKLKKSGLPWERSKSFEQSAPIGIFNPYDAAFIDLENWSFTCSVNQELRQQGNTRDMIFSVKNLIHTLSRWWKLQPGDIIFTGTPAGVGPLNPGDRIQIESPNIGTFSWNILFSNKPG